MALIAEAIGFAPADEGVPTDTFIKLTFNTEVKSEFLEPGNVGTYFQLYRTSGFQKIGVEAGKASGDALNVYLQPLQELEPSTQYTLIVLNSVANTADETLGNNWVQNFVTGSLKSNETITISNGIVTFNNVAPPVNPPVTPGDKVSFIDTNNNLVGSETGIPQFHYEAGPGAFLVDDQSGALRIEFSNPENHEVGVDPFTNISLYWNKDIADRYINQIKVTGSDLPFDSDVFGDKSLNSTPSIANPSTIDIAITDESAVGSTLNREYCVTIPPGAVECVDDSNIRNSRITIKFSGPLSPIFCTPDMIRTHLTGSDGTDLISGQSDYSLWKKIHATSLLLVNLLGRQPDVNSPEMFWVVRYVCCKVASDLLRGPVDLQKYVKSRTVLGQTVSWGNVTNDMGKRKSPLEECWEMAATQLGIGGTGPEIGVKSMETLHYPGRHRMNCLYDDRSGEFY